MLISKSTPHQSSEFRMVRDPFAIHTPPNKPEKETTAIETCKTLYSHLPDDSNPSIIF
jgi:hypothetical protein